tara:strand:+ start:967 stop:1395 length:429 start_codon:yes stop_codon:yes gene_type:complete
MNSGIDSKIIPNNLKLIKPYKEMLKMGFNTTVVVLNDALHQIQEDPEFGKRLHKSIGELGGGSNVRNVDVPAIHGNSVHCNAATVIETHHVDETTIIAVGGNMGKQIGNVFCSANADPLEIVKQLADQLGYTLHKKRIPPCP